MFEISLNRVKKYMDATLVLKDITFQVYAGEKVGIVGVNGSGKTTILKLLAGIEPLNCFPGYPQTTSHGYDEGIISIPKDATIAYLEQIPQYDQSLKVLDVLNLAFEEVKNIENEMHLLEEKMKYLKDHELEIVLKQYSNLIQLFEVKGGYEIEEKFNRICTGLKFTNHFLNKNFSLLSGGEKTTVILGKLLMDHPDILLLDEPTNHLDIDSIEWLENYIRGYVGIVIIVSHDRYFLDHTVTKIIEVEDLESETYKGNYSEYAYQKEEKMRLQFETFKEQQKKINSMEKTIKELRDWAIRGGNNKFFRRAASIQIKLDKIERVEKPVFEKENMKLNIKDTNRSGNETIKAMHLYKNFKDKDIFKDANLLVQFGERVALIGPNGSGKTTFVKMLLGEEIADSGTIELGANAKVAYLPQIVTFLNEDLTVLECFREDISLLEGKAREYLSKFMFYGSNVFKKVRQLSGGERIRLKLAKLLYEEVNLLILDEPTNHLDFESIETFEEALEEFKGTIFFISHDRYFINKMCNRVIAIEDHTFKSYFGNYDDYKYEKDKQQSLLITKEPQVIKVNKSKPSNESKKKVVEKEQIEKRIENLENEIREIEQTLTNSNLDYIELINLTYKKDDLNKLLNADIDLWISINQ